MVAIDPGLNGCGLAEFAGSNLVSARYVKNVAAKTELMEVRVYGMAFALRPYVAPHPWIFERPRVYLGKRLNPDDLIPLAEIGACLSGMTTIPIRVYRPRDWKGSIDGDAMVERIKTRLTPAEHSRIHLPAKSLEHNVYDSIGIGLAYLGRLERKRVYPR